MTDSNNTSVSLSDLAGDFEELRYLYLDRINSFQTLLKKIKNDDFYQYKNTYNSIIEVAQRVNEELHKNYDLLSLRSISTWSLRINLLEKF